MTRITAIIQARMGSSRLPGKVLLELGGKTVLSRVVSRLRCARSIDEIWVATTVSSQDDVIVAHCDRLGIDCFRGSEKNVLDRYYQCARACFASTAARITSDCPLIDPELVDDAIEHFCAGVYDYASNGLVPTYPRGLDVEIFTMSALHRAWQGATKPHQREHVTPFFYENPQLFRLLSLTADQDYSRYRWTLDTADDLALLRQIYSRFDNQDAFGWRDVLDLMKREPQLAHLNGHVIQKAVMA